ncbi:hypothetical protein WA016_04366 [Myxococcus stipitatus]
MVDPYSDRLLPLEALLKPNHHALFDEGLWTPGKRNTIELAKSLPMNFKATFGPALVCRWDLDPSCLRWHRTTVFKR